MKAFWAAAFTAKKVAPTGGSYQCRAGPPQRRNRCLPDHPLVERLLAGALHT